jgi:hypothetical protein
MVTTIRVVHQLGDRVALTTGSTEEGDRVVDRHSGRSLLDGRAVAAIAVAALVATGGCASAATSDVQSAAQRFQTAIRDHQPEVACGMLSDEARSSLQSTSARPCDQALDALHLSGAAPGAIEVWGDNAQVRLPGGALFLAEFSAGWKITGAGCTPRSGRPYACSVRS